MMKFIKRFGLVLPMIVLIAACEDLDQELFSEIEQDVVLNSSDPTVISVLRAGAYTPLIGTWGAHNSLWSVIEISSDEMVITHKGADWEDGGQWIRTHRHEYLPSEQGVGNGWNYVFSGIAAINNLLLQFSDNESLAAELRSLRALTYLWLIDNWGNVPISIETDTNPTPPNATRAEVFTFIENSILDNQDLLSRENSRTTMNYWVAQAVLMKLYLNAEVYIGTDRYADAIAAADRIINGGEFSLTSNFFSNFSANNGNSSETIFAIPYDANNGQGFNLPQMTLHYASQATFDLQEQPWNGYASQEDFYNSFESGDARILSFLEGPQFASDGTRLIDDLAEDADPDGTPLTFTPEINELRPTSLRQAGVRVGKFEFQSGSSRHLSNDFPIFRYADVLLSKAEAIWRSGGSDAEALELINQIRTRAGVEPMAALNADALLAERGREFFAEGWRRSDLIRFGKFNDPWWEKPASAATANLLPIPQSVTNINPNITQNPGY